MIPKKTAEEVIVAHEVQSKGSPVSGSPLWTIDEVASYLQLTPETVRAMARQQEIPAFKIHRRWRFRGEDVREWVNKMAQPKP
jgi:excisionase family DNA binding protein